MELLGTTGATEIAASAGTHRSSLAAATAVHARAESATGAELSAARTLELLGTARALRTAAELSTAGAEALAPIESAAALIVHAVLHVFTDALAGELALLRGHVAEALTHALSGFGRQAARAAIVAATTLELLRTARATGAGAELLAAVIAAAAIVAACALLKTLADALLGFRTLFGRKIAEVVHDALAGLGRELIEVEPAGTVAAVIHAAVIALGAAVIAAIVGIALVAAAGTVILAGAGAWAIHRRGACLAAIIRAGTAVGLGECGSAGQTDGGRRGEQDRRNTSHGKAPESCA